MTGGRLKRPRYAVTEERELPSLWGDRGWGTQKATGATGLADPALIEGHGYSSHSQEQRALLNMEGWEQNRGP